MRYLLPLLLVSLSAGAVADQHKVVSADQAAKELANPNSALASLTLKNRFISFAGDLPDANQQSGYLSLFQPSMPFPLANGDKIFFRPAFPFIYQQPSFNGNEFTDESGLGDIGFDLSYAPKSDGEFVYSFGVAASLPTATNSALGSDKMTLGPELFLGKKADNYIAGVFPNHQWDVAGPGDEQISRTSMQAFAVMLPGGGWSYGTAPTFTYDWVNDEWTIPLHLTLNRTSILKGRPWRFGVELQYFVERPDAFGPRWMMSLNVTPVVKNIFAQWSK
jgi:hypothetical protein